MRTNSVQVFAAVACAAFICTLASAQQPERAPPTSTGETIEVTGSPHEVMVMLKPPRPKYPRVAKGISGWVRVECLVSQEGLIQSVRVVASQPTGLFDQAAIDAMKYARFSRSRSAQPRLMQQRLIFSPE